MQIMVETPPDHFVIGIWPFTVTLACLVGLFSTLACIVGSLLVGSMWRLALGCAHHNCGPTVGKAALPHSNHLQNWRQ